MVDIVVLVASHLGKSRVRIHNNLWLMIPALVKDVNVFADAVVVVVLITMLKLWLLLMQMLLLL